MTKVKTDVMYKQVSKVMPGSEVSQKAVLTVLEGQAQAYLTPGSQGSLGKPSALDSLHQSQIINCYPLSKRLGEKVLWNPGSNIETEAVIIIICCFCHVLQSAWSFRSSTSWSSKQH